MAVWVAVVCIICRPAPELGRFGYGFACGAVAFLALVDSDGAGRRRAGQSRNIFCRTPLHAFQSRDIFCLKPLLAYCCYVPVGLGVALFWGAGLWSLARAGGVTALAESLAGPTVWVLGLTLA